MQLYLTSCIPGKRQHTWQKAEDLSLSKHITPSGWVIQISSSKKRKNLKILFYYKTAWESLICSFWGSWSTDHKLLHNYSYSMATESQQHMHVRSIKKQNYGRKCWNSSECHQWEKGRASQSFPCPRDITKEFFQNLDQRGVWSAQLRLNWVATGRTQNNVLQENLQNTLRENCWSNMFLKVTSDSSQHWLCFLGVLKPNILVC